MVPVCSSLISGIVHGELLVNDLLASVFTSIDHETTLRYLIVLWVIVGSLSSYALRFVDVGK